MKLSKILNELQQSSKRGTVVISAYDLIDQMEQIGDMGIKVERTDGLSPDGKTYLEFTVYPEGPEELDQAFTVYDYKFGEDPTDEDNFRTEYPFSLGARKRSGVVNASNLGLEIRSMAEASGAIGVDQMGDTSTDINITNDTSMYDPLKENLKDLANKSGMKLSDLMAKIKSIKDKEKDQTEKDAFKQSALAEGDDKMGEIKFHLDAYRKGTINADDLAQAIEEIVYGKVVAPGMKEDIDSTLDPYEDRKEIIRYISRLIKREKGASNDQIKDFIETHYDDLINLNGDDEYLDEFEQFVSVNTDYVDESVEFFQKIGGIMPLKGGNLM